MHQATALVFGLIATLFGAILSAYHLISSALRSLLAEAGITGPIQSAVLIAVAIVFALTALQVFGRVFLFLVGLLLLIFVLHALGGAIDPSLLRTGQG